MTDVKKTTLLKSQWSSEIVFLFNSMLKSHLYKMRSPNFASFKYC